MTHENVEVAQANNAKPEVAENATKAVVEGKEAALKIEKLNGVEPPDAAGDKAADAAVETNGHITPSDAPVEASTSDKKEGEEVKNGEEKSEDQKDQEKTKKKSKRFSFNKLKKMFSFKEKDNKKKDETAAVKEEQEGETKEAEPVADAGGDASKTEDTKKDEVSEKPSEEVVKKADESVVVEDKTDDSTKTEEKKE